MSPTKLEWTIVATIGSGIDPATEKIALLAVERFPLAKPGKVPQKNEIERAITRRCSRFRIAAVKQTSLNIVTPAKKFFNLVGDSRTPLWVRR
jgi:hypothetical protein